MVLTSHQLKGSDATVYRAFRAAGLKISFHYVLIVEESGWGIQSNKPYILKSKDWLRADSNYAEDGGTVDIIQSWKGALVSQLGVEELQTTKKTFTRGGKGKDKKTTTHHIDTPFTFLAHGNEPSIDTDYASICIIGCPTDYDLESHWPEKPAEEDSD